MYYLDSRYMPYYMYIICRHFLSVACSGPNYHYSVIFSFHVANIYSSPLSTTASVKYLLLSIISRKHHCWPQRRRSSAPHQHQAGEAADSEIRCKWRAVSGGQELNIFSGNYVNIFMRWVYWELLENCWVGYVQDPGQGWRRLQWTMPGNSPRRRQSSSSEGSTGA